MPWSARIPPSVNCTPFEPLPESSPSFSPPPRETVDEIDHRVLALGPELGDLLRALRADRLGAGLWWCRSGLLGERRPRHSHATHRGKDE